MNGCKIVSITFRLNKYDDDDDVDDGISLLSGIN